MPEDEELAWIDGERDALADAEAGDRIDGSGAPGAEAERP